MSADHDPYADLIGTNQEAIVRVLREALRRIRAALDAGDVPLARRVIDAAMAYHPMHPESFPGWPE
jgi:alkylation response protein AidB-like acyl-CoA dehydrogenase